MRKLTTEDAFTLAAYRKCEAIADGMVLSLVVHGDRDASPRAVAEWIRNEIRKLMEPLK